MGFKHGAGIGVIELDNNSGTVVDVSQYIRDGVSTEVKRETSDSTALPDVAKKFLQGLEDGGEMPVTFMIDDAAPSVIWTQVSALYNSKNLATFGAYPQGKTTNYPKMTREVGVTGITLPVKNDDGVTFTATLKAHGSTTVGVV